MYAVYYVKKKINNNNKRPKRVCAKMLTVTKSKGKITEN